MKKILREDLQVNDCHESCERNDTNVNVLPLEDFQVFILVALHFTYRFLDILDNWWFLNWKTAC